MTGLVVYDSVYGNTERIARAIGAALDGEIRAVASVSAEDVQGCSMLVVGSPTQGGRPTAPIADLLKRLPPDSIRGRGVAAFDTRMSAADSGFAMRLLLRVLDYAAPRIAKVLRAKGGNLLAEPEGFLVEGKEGPLKEGEEERAAAWARSLKAAVAGSR